MNSDDQDVIHDLIMHSVSREWELPSLSGDSGVTPRWRRAFLAFRFADLIAQVETGIRLQQLSVEDRAWLKGQCQQLIDDAEARFSQPKDNGTRYLPELEPEYHSEGKP